MKYSLNIWVGWKKYTAYEYSINILHLVASPAGGMDG